MNIRAQIYGGGPAIGDSPLLGVKRPKGARSDVLDSVPVFRSEARTSA